MFVWVFIFNNCSKKKLPPYLFIFFLALEKNKLIISNFTENTDHELLSLIQQRNEQAFEILYKRYYSLLCKKAFQRIPSVPRVEEIVQDVFINFWKKAPTLDAEGNVRAYLYATLKNNILHGLRTEHTRVLYMEKLKNESGEAVTASSLNTIYANEVASYIDQIITSLSPQCREAFRLSRFEHLSYKEISEHMGISVNTVEKHVSKALRILRAGMSKHGGF